MPTQSTPRSRRRLVLRVVLLGLLFPMLATAAPAAAYEPPGGTVFNNPFGNYAAKNRIVMTITAAVRNARAGSTIQMSMFLMDGKNAADQLIRARNRGVRVQLVFDGNDGRSAQARRMASRFNADNRPGQPIPERWGPDQSFVVFCKGSCRGGSASGNNNHTKFYTFTQTGTANNVVMVSSSNLNRGGAVRGWNDMYVAKGRPQMLQQYSRIHYEMSRDVPAGDRYREVRDGNLISRFYPKPSGGDPVMADLNNVRCRGVSGGAGRNGRTAINVSMFAWNNERGETIARKLIRLDRDGCDVSIIYGAPSKRVRLLLTGSARRGGVKLWDSRFDRNGDGVADVRSHHKYMLINGHYGADQSAWRVHAGSQNWGRGTLRGGDENTLTIISRATYRSYMGNWGAVQNRSRRIGG